MKSETGWAHYYMLNTCGCGKCRGATCFAWDELRAMLAVGLKKRLLLFHYTGTDFVELKDVTLAEAPLTASWAGNYVCLACKAMCDAPQSDLILATIQRGLLK